MTALVASLLSLAVSLTGIPAPEYPPQILRVTEATLELLGCKAGCPGIAALSSGDKIFVNNTVDLNETRGAAVLFHELVHFLQYSKSGVAKNCAEWLDREVVAYQLTNVVLHRAGARLVQMPSIRCEETTKEIP